VDIPVKVISLARTQDRRDAFARQNPHLAFEFFEAVDGRALGEEQLRDPQLFVQPLKYTRGAYGCALSHLQLWDQAIALGQPVTVAEDDAVFRNDFHEQSKAVMAQLPQDWDLVMWGWNFDSILSLMSMAGVSPAIMVFNQDVLCENIANFQASTTRSHPLGLDRCFGTVAYTISPAGARRFRQQCFPIRHFDLYFPVLDKELANSGIDIAMNAIYADTQSFAAFPPLVATRNERNVSTVQTN
jgi:GR25 family glycosyltransferase involved in LPS biosynthesis